GSVLHGRTYYQEVLRVPLLIQGPGIPAGKVVGTPVSGVDVTPTILALMSIPSSQPRDGFDLTPTWNGGTVPERLLFSEADHNNKIDGEFVYDIRKMVRRGEEKLLLDTHTGKQELYDLTTDKAESRDLAGTQPDQVSDLRAQLERFLAGTVE